jgi:hypothetical protein
MPSSPFSWRASRAVVLLVGVATAWPLAWCAFFIAIVASVFLGDSFPDDGDFEVLIIGHLLTALLLLLTTVGLACDVFANPSVPEHRRALWLVVLLLAQVVAAPAYWYRHLWRPVSAAR